MEKSTKKIEDYTQERNTLKRAVKDYAPDKVELEIGDSKSDEFIPQAKIMRWDNETNFSIRRDNGARSFIERDGKVVAESADENVVIYELEPDEQNEDGGLEIEIELPRQPKSNIFEFTLQTKGLNFYYQAPLTPEEIAEGASRPENVEGSYAVYHATKRDNRVGGKEYKTGKAFHIYRPKAIDADGAEVWCELSIDEQAGVLTVTVPQAWLAKVSYPVRVDPTFGYTSVGSGLGGGGADEIYGIVSTAPESGDIQKLTSYSGTDTNPRKAGVYSSDRQSFLGGAAEVIPDAEDWHDHAVDSSIAITASNDYYLVIWYDVNSTIRYDVGSTGDGIGQYNDGVNYTYGAAWPTDISNSQLTDRIHSIYATYTTPPAVDTDPVTNIAETTADANGEITSGADIEERGFVYDTTSRSKPEGDPASETLLNTESFESNFGDWLNDAGNTDDWLRKSGGTGSSNTGPSSAYDGTQYIYCETSGNYNQDFTIEYNVTLNKKVKVDFYRHMYGSNMGTLYLESFDGTSWTTEWSLSGDQGNSWVNEEVTTASLVERIRFRYVSGTSYRGDCALDLIKVYEVVPEDPAPSPAASDYASVENETGTFGTGTYSLGLTGLTAETTYYVRAYVEKDGVYYYADTEESFTTTSGATDEPPTVTTQAVTDIAETTATGNGDVTDDGGGTITRRGFVYSTTSYGDPGNVSPAASDYGSVEDATGTFGEATFDDLITGLQPDTTYYVRAFAENSAGFSYGSQVSFITEAGDTNPQVKVSGTFGSYPVKVKQGGTFSDAALKVKVGGTFQ